MPAKLTLHPPRRASRFLVVRDGESLVIGRDPECDLVLEDGRVSKRHARFAWTGSAWLLEDLGSKNGTSVNGRIAERIPLVHGDWLSFGGLMGRFEGISESDARGLQAERLARLQTSLAMKRRLAAELEPFDLLLKFLESAIEVVGGERGFVLLAGADGVLRAEVATGFSRESVADERFDGSLGALERVVESRSAVVVCDAQSDPYLGVRESVARKGLGALACVPLVHEARLIGALYVDSRKPGAQLSELDLEILGALAEHTALVIANVRLDRRIRSLLRAPPGAAPEGSVLEDLARRIAERVPKPEAPRPGEPRA